MDQIENTTNHLRLCAIATDSSLYCLHHFPCCQFASHSFPMSLQSLLSLQTPQFSSVFPAFSHHLTLAPVPYYTISLLVCTVCSTFPPPNQIIYCALLAVMTIACPSLCVQTDHLLTKPVLNMH